MVTHRSLALLVAVLSASLATAAACGSEPDAPSEADDAGASDDARAPDQPDASGADDASAPHDASAPQEDGGDDAAAYAAEYLYAIGTIDAQTGVVGFRRAPGTTALTPIDMDAVTPGVQPKPTGATPRALAVHPNKKFLYVVNSADKSIGAYAINATAGTLDAIPAVAGDGGASTFPVGSLPVYLGMDPKGRCLYVVDQGNSINALTIDPITGALSPGRSAKSATSAQWITVDAQARFVVVTGTGYDIAIHRLDPASGLPLALDGGVGDGTRYTTFNTSYDVALDPAGKTAFLSDPYHQKLHAFAIEQTSFAMTPLPPTSTTFYPANLLVAPSGAFLYAAGLTPGAPLGAFTIGDGGALSPLETDAMAPGAPGYPLVFDPSATHLYVGGSVPLVTEVGVNADGTLSTTGVTSATNGATATPVAARSFVWVRY